MMLPAGEQHTGTCNRGDSGGSQKGDISTENASLQAPDDGASTIIQDRHVCHGIEFHRDQVDDSVSNTDAEPYTTIERRHVHHGNEFHGGQFDDSITNIDASEVLQDGEIGISRGLDVATLSTSSSASASSSSTCLFETHLRTSNESILPSAVSCIDKASNSFDVVGDGHYEKAGLPSVPAEHVSFSNCCASSVQSVGNIELSNAYKNRLVVDSASEPPLESARALCDESTEICSNVFIHSIPQRHELEGNAPYAEKALSERSSHEDPATCPAVDPVCMAEVHVSKPQCEPVPVNARSASYEQETLPPVSAISESKTCSGHASRVMDPAYVQDVLIKDPSYESSSLNSSVREGFSLHSPESETDATGHNLMGIKGEPAQFIFSDAAKNRDIQESLRNYFIPSTTAEKYGPEHSSVNEWSPKEEFKVNEADVLNIIDAQRFAGNSSMYDQTGGGEAQDTGVHMEASSEAPEFTAKGGLTFSGSSYYTSQSSRMRKLAMLLRSGSAIFSLIAFSVIISTNEKRIAAGSTFYVKFSDYQAYNGQLVLLKRGRTTTRVLSSPVKWGASLYLCDQILAFLMTSSSSSAATASELSWNGLHSIWPPACSTWGLSLFCSRADVAVAMGFVSCLFMFLITFSSGYHLSVLLAE
ncbi:hypothetical protein KP509_36G015900 [Ceratopteris richardii]|uniref:Casparian strip membrane protein domain-containing protein n=1 Tax=Ceratopteris richardii TaxID=49495 RepID=A0A8T2QC76_CERRI|nr:hypothetical protein KP509_36G015900 [Ceratopteris richardii]